MNSLGVVHIAVQEGFTQEDANRSLELAEQIEQTLQDIQTGHTLFITGFAKLGVTLLEVRSKKYWKLWNFETFGSYIKNIEGRVQKGRSQLYNSITVAERLLPYISTEQIEQMGISKATELGKLVKNTGVGPSDKLIEIATNPETDSREFEAAANTEYKYEQNTEKGEWYTVGGFFATIDEINELDYGFEVASRTDPVITKETSEWSRRKESLLRMVREYIGTYGAQVERGEG